MDVLIRITQVLILIISIIGAALVIRSRSRQRIRALAGRPDLNTNQIWEQFYKDSAIPRDVFDAAWGLICKRAKLDPRKLRPTDRIRDFTDQNPSWNTAGDEWEDVAFQWNYRAGQLGLKVDWKTIDTVDKIVRLVVECLQREEGHPR